LSPKISHVKIKTPKIICLLSIIKTNSFKFLFAHERKKQPENFQTAFSINTKS